MLYVLIVLPTLISISEDQNEYLEKILINDYQYEGK